MNSRNIYVYGVHCTVDLKKKKKVPLEQAKSPALAVPRFSPAAYLGTSSIHMDVLVKRGPRKPAD